MGGRALSSARVLKPSFAKSQNCLAQFIWVAGFDKVFASAELRGAKFVLLEIGIRKNNDGQPGVGGTTLHEIQNGESIHTRHFQINEEQVRHGKVLAICELLPAFEIVNGLFAVVDETKFMGEFLPGAGCLEKPAVVLVVFRYENRVCPGHRVSHAYLLR